MTRWIIGALAVMSLVGLFALTSPDRVVTDATVVPLIEPTTTTAPSRESRTAGSLPNGIEFLVTVDPGVSDEWLGSTGTILMDIEGLPASVGSVGFLTEPNDEYSYSDGRYRIPAAGYLIVIDFHDHVLRALGDTAEQIITDSIRGGSEFGFPVLRLDDPFRWGTDDQSPVRMTARFSTFEVRRGCDEVAATCSADRTLQVIWLAQEVASAPPLQQTEVRIHRLVP